MSKKPSQKPVSVAKKQRGDNTKITSTEKKPLYKQWWFWVIIVVILAAIGASHQSQSPQSDNTDQPKTSSVEKSEYAVGEAATINGQEVTVLSVERNYQTGNEYVHPSDGKEFVKINLQIVNNSDDRVSYNAFNVKIEEGDGNIHDYSSSVLAQADDSIGHGELSVGGRKTGSIVFEVPAGDSNLKLHFKPSSITSKEVVFKL